MFVHVNCASSDSRRDPAPYGEQQSKSGRRLSQNSDRQSRPRNVPLPNWQIGNWIDGKQQKIDMISIDSELIGREDRYTTALWQKMTFENRRAAVEMFNFNFGGVLS